MKMPSLTSLRAFEAAARLGNATKAAAELSVTQSAVSHQIRELELFLGLQLFIRNGRRLSPNPSARRLAESIQEGFSLIAKAIGELQNPTRDKTLTISMLPALATKWLAPRLTDFIVSNPGIDLRISASRHLVEFGPDGIDTAIRYGLGQWPKVSTEHITDEVLVPVMSPKLFESIHVSVPADLLKLPLLKGDLLDSWEDWFHNAGVGLPIPNSVLQFSDDAALIEAAAAGSGVALGRSVLVADDLRNGRLIAPIRIAKKATYSYWLVRREAAKQNLAATSFASWAKASLRETAIIVDQQKLRG